MNPVATTACENAAQRVYIVDGKAYEGFWLDGQFIFENGIRNTESFTRTHPGWVLNDNGYCQWAGDPPVRIPGLSARYADPAAASSTAIANQNTPQNMQADIAGAGDSGGAFLLLIGLIAAAGYAVYQWKNGKEDFSEDYHPMEDAPALPTVYTDENLDQLYGHVSYPQYQGIDAPNPWQSHQVFPQSHQPPPPPNVTTSSPVTPTDTAVTGIDSVTGDGAATGAGDETLKRAREYFESELLPAPKGGYFLGEESLLSRGQAYQIVRQALELGYSKNWLCEYVFKIPKGGNGAKYKILTELVNRVKGELGHE